MSFPTNLEEFLERLHEEEYPRIPGDRLLIDLSTARDNEAIEVPLPGGADRITILEAVTTPTKRVYARFNRKDGPIFPFDRVGSKYWFDPKFKIRRIYLTHEADPGGYLLIGLGGDAAFDVSVGQTVQVIGESQVALTGNDLVLLASTTDALANGSSWASGWLTADRYGAIILTCVTDVDLSVDIEWSWDGNEVDARESDTILAADSPFGTEVKVLATYVRVRVTNNSGSDQTSMRLHIGGRVV